MKLLPRFVKLLPRIKLLHGVIVYSQKVKLLSRFVKLSPRIKLFDGVIICISAANAKLLPRVRFSKVTVAIHVCM